MRTWFVVSLYAGCWGKTGSPAWVRAVGRKKMCIQTAASMQAAAGGQAANVVYLAMDADKAQKKYALRA